MLLKLFPALNGALESSVLVYCAVGLIAAAAIPLFWFEVFRIQPWLAGIIHALSMKKTSPIFLEHKTKKIWVDEKSGLVCFLWYARSLLISGGNDSRWWTWNCFKETSEENIEVARLRTICWLEIKGTFNITEIPPGIEYEVLYVVKLTNGAEGWEFPVKLSLYLLGVEVRRRQVTLLEKPRGEWLELSVGTFTRRDEMTGQVSFEFSQLNGHWKLGLVVKGAIVRPKH